MAFWLKWVLGVVAFLALCGLYALALGMCRVADREDRRMGMK